MKTTNIYVLIDPETQKVRYVGKANNISQRYKAHLNRARKHQIHKLNWVNSLKIKGLKPIIEVIDVVPIEDWVFWEIYWISQFKTWGFNLINYTDGGEGCTFANQTSFKKGNISWNKGTLKERVCIECSNIFKPTHNNSSQKYCSYKCAGVNRKSSTQFNKNRIPWNKNIKGYKTSKRKIVLQFDLHSNFIKEWENSLEAAKAYKSTGQNIRSACIGKSKTAVGYKWKYK
jgi:hypothetical protein